MFRATSSSRFSVREFSGDVFCQQVDGGRALAVIDLQRSGICAETDEGDRFEIPFSQCQVRLGGYRNRIVFCRKADRRFSIVCDDPTFPSALADASLGILYGQIDAQFQHGRSQISPIGLGFLMGLAMLFVVGYFAIMI